MRVDPSGSTQPAAFPAFRAFHAFPSPGSSSSRILTAPSPTLARRAGVDHREDATDPPPNAFPLGLVECFWTLAPASSSLVSRTRCAEWVLRPTEAPPFMRGYSRADLPYEQPTKTDQTANAVRAGRTT